MHESSVFAYKQYGIVADIGGTNARFCRVHLPSLKMDKVVCFPCADFPSLGHAWQAYQEAQSLDEITSGAVAIACPVTEDLVSMTNCPWQFSQEQLRRDLGLGQLYVINDFLAIALCLPLLDEGHKLSIGGGRHEKNKPMVVVGAGTGLGVACLLPVENYFYPLAGEGGHGDLPIHTEQEWFIHRYLAAKYGHVSAERVLSGSGLEDLYLALAAYQHLSIQPLTAAEIARRALTEECTLAVAVIQQFFSTLGSFAGNLSLSFAAFGGVYLAGGIVPKLIKCLLSSDFRQRFEDKGRFQGFNAAIATSALTLDYPGLLGAAAYLKQKAEQNYGTI